jgi:hypothetical protein
MEQPAIAPRERTGRAIRGGLFVTAAVAMFALGFSAPALLRAPADAAPRPLQLPAPPPNGVMGFVVDGFVSPVIQGKDACPQGTAMRLKDVYLSTLPEAERARLSLKENEQEFTQR